MNNRVNKQIISLAVACLQAKDRLMETESDDAFEVALRRVNFFCND
jgi:hypothetical protein